MRIYSVFGFVISFLLGGVISDSAFAQTCQVQITEVTQTPSGPDRTVGENNQFVVRARFTGMTVGNQWGYIAKRNGMAIPNQSINEDVDDPQNTTFDDVRILEGNSLSVLDAGTYSFEFYARCGEGNTTVRTASETAVINVKPRIRVNLLSRSAKLGDPVPPFSVVAEQDVNGGTSALRYRWQRLDASNQWQTIAGATASTYSAPGVLDLSDLGQYRVIVGHSERTGSQNEQESAIQYLVVDFEQSRADVCRAPSVLAQPQPITRDEGANTIDNGRIFEARFTSGIGQCWDVEQKCFSLNGDGSCAENHIVYRCSDYRNSRLEQTLYRSPTGRELKSRREWWRGPTPANPLVVRIRNDWVQCSPEANGVCPNWDGISFRIDEPRFHWVRNPVELADDQHYRVIYHDPCANQPVGSNTVRLTVNPVIIHPTITNIPTEAQTFDSNSSPDVEGGWQNGSPTLAFEWYKYSGGSPSGAATRVDQINRAPLGSIDQTRENLSIPNIRIQDAGWYRYELYRVENPTVRATSNVEVRVRTPGVLYGVIGRATSPIYPGDAVTASVSVLPAEDANFVSYAYEWLDQNGNSFVPARTGPTMTFTAGAAGTVHSFKVRISNRIFSANGVSMPGFETYETPTGSFTVSTAPTQGPSISSHPFPQSVSEGDNAIFSVLAAGTAPLTYQWLKNETPLSNGGRISGATSASLQISSAQLSDQGSYSVRVNNSVGPQVTSQAASLTVVSLNQAPSILTQPQNQTVAEGSAVSFSVTAGGTAPFTYQWLKNGVALSNGGRISGATSASLQISATTSADQGTYSVRVGNAVGPQVTSQGASLSVTSVAAPGVPTFTYPSNNATNVPENLTFTWNAPAGATSALTYEFFVAAKGSSDPVCDSVVGANKIFLSEGASLFFTVPGGVLLLGDTYYVACARAKNSIGVPGLYAKTTFRTRNQFDPTTIPKPIIQIEPSTVNGPSGQVFAEIVGTQGELGSTVRIYQIVGTEIRNAGSIQVTDSQGSFRVTVNVLAHQAGAGVRRYFAQNWRTQNSSASIPGPQSDVATYQFDPRLTLPAPVVTLESEDPVAKLRWKEVPTATSYQVWRRVGAELCQSSETVTCYQGVKPFKRLSGTVTTISVDGVTYFEFSDNLNVASLPTGGASYFVTAHNASAESKRSKSVSVADRVAPKKTTENFVVLPGRRGGSTTGRDLIGLLCGVDPNGFFAGDVAADLLTEIKFVEKPTNSSCAANLFNGVPPADYAFDAIFPQPHPDLEYSSFDCLLAMEIKNLAPTKSYCIQACLKDLKSNIDRNDCLIADGNTGSDEVAPAFDGIVSLTPMPSGEALKANWNLAEEDVNTNEVIQYQVRAASFFDSAGSPDFSHSTTLLKTVDRGVNSLNFVGLRTNADYCLKVDALDETGNPPLPTGYLCSKTLSNLPEIRNVQVKPGLNPWEIEVTGVILHRLAGTPGNQISLEKFQFQLEGEEEWVEVDFEYLSGDPLDNLPHGTSLATARPFRIIFDTLPFLRGEVSLRVALQVRDNNRNRSLLAGNSADGSPVDPNLVADHRSDLSATPSDYIMVGKSQFSGHTSGRFAGCSIVDQSDNRAMTLLALVVMFVTFFGVRFFAFSRRRK